MDIASTWYLVGAASASLAVAPRVQRRLLVSRAKQPTLGGHPRIARFLAQRLPHYEYSDERFFCTDDAAPAVVEQRKAGFFRLSRALRERMPATMRCAAEVSESVSDAQFTERYRVPFQYSRFARAHLPASAVVTASEGVHLVDLDGNRLYDLTGSYGVNLFGHDFYKRCIERGAQRVADLGPVLGPYHPVIRDNVRRLREISGLDEVSFHMSGTEAVMQAVRLARYHTGRPRLVRFCGAYHGWWGDVQPGVGNPMTARDTYTFKEMHETSLRAIRARSDIACVLVNPMQALHPNQAAPADSTLVDSSRSAHFDREAYAAWLSKLRALCTERNIVLIFDEVFAGFRLGVRGAQAYFDVRADMVTYGKTLGGGLPVGVLCGRAALMRRFREDHPTDVCFARGTFNSHPYVLGAMAEFLDQLETPEIKAVYRDLHATWDRRTEQLNRRFAALTLPIRIENMSSVWTLCYLRPSPYNWLFQFYLRAEGLALSWTGTGRLIFSLNYTEADVLAVGDRVISAAQAMLADGFWSSPETLTNRGIKRRIMREWLGLAKPT